MQKVAFDEYAHDTRDLGIKARRYGYAAEQLTTEEAVKTRAEFIAASKAFAGKYGMAINAAKDIGFTIADTCDLGLAY